LGVGFAVALCGAVLGGCGGGAEESSEAVRTGSGSEGQITAAPGKGAPKTGGSRPRLLFISNSNADWWTALETGMKDGGKDFGADVQLNRNEGQTQGQIRLLEDAEGLGDVKGVAVSVFEAEAPGIADAMRRLKDAGKVVITVDSDIVASAADTRVAYIGTNNVKAGEAAGKAAAVLRPQGGKTCIFVGNSSAANARERKQGFFRGGGKAFTELETFDDNTDKAKAQSNVQTALAKHSDVGVLLGLWSYNAPRIAEEIAGVPDMRKRVTVVTFDLDELAVGHLERGDIDLTVCQNPYEMGYQGVRLLKALIERDSATVKEILPDGKTRDTGVRIIVPKDGSPVKGDNVITIEEMKKWMASKGLKSS
jgi:ribose transport system substrate-binding protein